MRWTRGLNKWAGQISITGTTANPAISAEERRKLRPNLPRTSSHSASIFVARNVKEFAQAEHLVRSAYASLGYDTEFLAQQNAHQRDDHSRLTLLADLDRQVAGTFTVFLDGPDGVQADLAYPDAIAALRRAGNAIVELGQFATLPFDNLQAAQTVISALHNGVYLICASLNEEQLRIVFEVNPHHVKYWCSLGWQVIGPPRLCDRVKAPGVLMVMDFADYTRTMLQCWPLHARNQQIVHRAWHRVIRYSMLWEDVDGVLARIGDNCPSHSDATRHGQASDGAIPPAVTNLIPTDPPEYFQAGSSHG